LRGTFIKSSISKYQLHIHRINRIQVLFEDLNRKNFFGQSTKNSVKCWITLCALTSTVQTVSDFRSLKIRLWAFNLFGSQSSNGDASDSDQNLVMVLQIIFNFNHRFKLMIQNVSATKMRLSISYLEGQHSRIF